MSKIQEIIQEWRGEITTTLTPTNYRHIDLLRALDILTDQIARVADALEARNEGAPLADASPADATQRWTYRVGYHDGLSEGAKREAK